jgi:hypothetical protein
MSQWIHAKSPYDTLVHYATMFAYNLAGEPALHLICSDQMAKLPRRRYETHEQFVNCITCLVNGGDR